jgi:hypothetical protein
MGQQIQMAQETVAGRRWLSMLIEAMEEAARTDLPECPVPAGLSLQLAQPGTAFPVVASRPRPAELTSRLRSSLSD